MVEIKDTFFPLDFPVGMCYYYAYHGAVAQVGERLSGRQKVRGSNPLSSTKHHFCKVVLLPLANYFL